MSGTLDKEQFTSGLSTAQSPLDSIAREDAKALAVAARQRFQVELPRHLKEVDTITSLGYVLLDLALLVAVAAALRQVLPLCSASEIATFCAGLAYALVQGTVAVGPWMLGHDAGHGALLPNRIANDALGILLHSFLLVPFHSWAYMHKVSIGVLFCVATRLAFSRAFRDLAACVGRQAQQMLWSSSS